MDFGHSSNMILEIMVVFFILFRSANVGAQFFETENCSFVEIRGVVNCSGENLTRIPYEQLSRFNGTIHTINLADNKLTAFGNTSLFYNLKYRHSITTLILNKNNITELPNHLDTLFPELLSLYLAHNNLTHISTEVCHLKSLIYLVLEENPIKTVVKQVHSCLPKLQTDVNLTKYPMPDDTNIDEYRDIRVDENQSPDNSYVHAGNYLVITFSIVILMIVKQSVTF